MDLRPENERYIEAGIREGSFRDRVDALDRAVDLLRQRDGLHQAIERGMAQLERGDHLVLNGENELHTFAREVKLRCRQAIEGTRRAE